MICDEHRITHSACFETNRSSGQMNHDIHFLKVNRKSLTEEHELQGVLESRLFLG